MLNMINLISALKGNKGGLSSMIGGGSALSSLVGGGSGFGNLFNSGNNFSNHNNFNNQPQQNFSNSNLNHSNKSFNSNQQQSFSDNSPYPYGQFPARFTKQGQEQIKEQSKLKHQGFYNQQTQNFQNQNNSPPFFPQQQNFQQPTSAQSGLLNPQIYPNQNNSQTQQSFNNTYPDNQSNNQQNNLLAQLMPLLNNQQGSSPANLFSAAQTQNNSNNNNASFANNAPSQGFGNNRTDANQMMSLFKNLNSGNKSASDLSSLLQPLLAQQGDNSADSTNLLNLLLKNLANKNVKGASNNIHTDSEKKYDIDSLKKIDD